MRVFLPVIGLGILLTLASANGVESFGPLLTWVILLGSLAAVVLLGLERSAE